jgi:hypothetical protein
MPNKIGGEAEGGGLSPLGLPPGFATGPVSVIFNFSAANATSFIKSNLFKYAILLKLRLMNGKVNLTVNYNNELHVRQAEFARALSEMRDIIHNIY